VVDGIKIYVLGGRIYNDEGYQAATDRVDVYDPAADSWQQMAAMPTARETNAAAVMDGKIYVSGGFTTSRELSDAFEAYDPVTNTWTTLASLSKARASHASAAAHGKLYVFGGFMSGGDCLDLVEVYSPASNSWARAAGMPSATEDFMAVAL
jgi:N-acetylneuraminic acid mutarotase